MNGIWFGYLPFDKIHIDINNDYEVSIPQIIHPQKSGPILETYRQDFESLMKKIFEKNHKQTLEYSNFKGLIQSTQHP